MRETSLFDPRLRSRVERARLRATRVRRSTYCGIHFKGYHSPTQVVLMAKATRGLRIAKQERIREGPGLAPKGVKGPGALVNEEQIN